MTDTKQAATAWPRPPLNGEFTNEDDLVFQVVDWFVPEADRDMMADVDRETPAPLYEIIMYGVTEEGHSVTAKVKGFEPYFFVKLPPKMQTNSLTHVRSLEEHLRNGRTRPLVWDLKKKKWVPREHDGPIIPARLRDHLQLSLIHI